MKAPIILFLLGLPLGGQTLTWDITVQTTNWPNQWEAEFRDQSFMGSIQVDSSRIKGEQRERLSFEQSDPAFSFAINFNEQIFTTFDDPAVGLPRLYFQDGDLTGVDFAVYLSSPPYAEGSYFQLHPDGLMTYSPDAVGEYEGRYRLTSSTSIPEPTTTFLSLFSLIFLLTLRIK